MNPSSNPAAGRVPSTPVVGSTCEERVAVLVGRLADADAITARLLREFERLTA